MAASGGPRAAARHRGQAPSPCTQELLPHERELLLDVTQVALAVVGFFDPTPTADGANAILSAYRGDWAGTALSAAGMVPYVGDLAKLGRLERYGATIQRAINVSVRSPRLERYLRPMLEPVYRVLSSVDAANVPSALKPALASLQRVFGRTITVVSAPRLTEALLVRRFGSAKVGPLVRKNVETVVDFATGHGMNLDDAAQLRKVSEWLSGIDLHKPLRVIELKKGAVLTQYVDEGGRLGTWFVQKGGARPLDLGIAAGDRTRHLVTVERDVKVLQSTAEAIADTWTTGVGGGNRWLYRYHRSQWKPSLTVKGKPADFVKGGGEQLLLPNSSQYVKIPTKP